MVRLPSMYASPTRSHGLTHNRPDTLGPCSRIVTLSLPPGSTLCERPAESTSVSLPLVTTLRSKKRNSMMHGPVSAVCQVRTFSPLMIVVERHLGHSLCARNLDKNAVRPPARQREVVSVSHGVGNRHRLKLPRWPAQPETRHLGTDFRIGHARACRGIEDCDDDMIR